LKQGTSLDTQPLLVIAAQSSALLLHFEHHIAGLTAPLIKLLCLASRLTLRELRVAI
jgi:hypothetical protein